MNRKDKNPTTNWFLYNNVNPKNKINGDCVIRAIANAMNKTWDEVNEDLFKYSVKYKTVLNDRHTFEKYLKDNNWVKCKQPRKENNKRYTGKEYVDKLNDQKEIIKSIYNDNINQIISIGGHHLSCIIFRNNQFRIEDIWDCSEWCVGNYWYYKVMN